jgi:hypothetical protein
MSDEKNTPSPVPGATPAPVAPRSGRILTAEQILGMDDLNVEEVEVPEWPVDGQPGIIRLKTMSAREAMNSQKQMNVSPKAREDAMINLIVMSAVDEKGDRIFTAKQVEMLRDKSMRVFVRLQKAAMSLNGFDDNAAASAKGN